MNSSDCEPDTQNNTDNHPQTCHPVKKLTFPALRSVKRSLYQFWQASCDSCGGSNSKSQSLYGAQQDKFRYGLVSKVILPLPLPSGQRKRTYTCTYACRHLRDKHATDRIMNIPNVKKRKKITPVCATGTPDGRPISTESTGNRIYKEINNSKLKLRVRIK